METSGQKAEILYCTRREENNTQQWDKIESEEVSVVLENKEGEVLVKFQVNERAACDRPGVSHSVRLMIVISPGTLLD